MQISNTIRRAVGATMLLALMGTTTAFAQSAYENKGDAWWDSLEDQLTASAQSEVPQVRQEAFRHIIFFAENYDDFVNFDEAAYDIMGLFETSEDTAERLLALAALSAIGENGTIKRLGQVVTNEKSARVRSMTTAVLQAHAASL